MTRYKVGKVLPWALLLGLPLLASSVYAAKPIDLSNQNSAVLGEFVSPDTAPAAMKVVETKRTVGSDQTTHVRIQEMYMGYTVWGADAVVHLPAGSSAKSLHDVMMATRSTKDAMDGTLYSGLQADLASASALVFTAAQAQKAEQQAIASYQQKIGLKTAVQNASSQLIVFVDSANKAHWAYLVKFYAEPAQANALPAKPAYIMDATTFHVYQQWDEIKTLDGKDNVTGGGFGGNIKMGKMVYDGLEGNLAALSVQRDASTETCYLQNDEVTVRDYKKRRVLSFGCAEADADHNNVYWDGDLDKVNDGYSPGNDALFGGAVIKNMYKNWYGLDVLTEDGKPMMLTMVVHDPIDNAYWDGQKMTFGDGVRMFYPLTSLGVAAHEISHGFTEQHSNLSYYGQSGGMNEAFSDMAAQAAEFYAYGKNSWQIGPEIFKAEDQALRYMDKPSKDCDEGKNPGDWCSIDNASQYYNGLDVHFSSGVYNRFFYTLGTTEGWNPQKAFGLMVEAQNFWTSSTNYSKGACGVMKAAAKKGYDTKAVKAAFAVVGVTSSCSSSN